MLKVRLDFNGTSLGRFKLIFHLFPSPQTCSCQNVGQHCINCGVGNQRCYNSHLTFLFKMRIHHRYPEAKSKIVPLLEILSNDTEPAVKQHLIEQLAPLAKVLKNDIFDWRTHHFAMSVFMQ